MADRQPTEQKPYRRFDNYLTAEVEPSWLRRQERPQDSGHRSTSLHRQCHSDDNSRHNETLRPRRSSDSGVAHTTSHSSRHEVPVIVHHYPVTLGTVSSRAAHTQLSSATRAQVPDPPKAPSPRLGTVAPPMLSSHILRQDTVRFTTTSRDGVRSWPPNSAQIPARHPHSPTNPALRPHSLPSITTGPDTLNPPQRTSEIAQTQPKITLPTQTDPDAISTLAAPSLGSGSPSLSSSGSLGAPVYQYGRLRGSQFRLVKIFRKTLETVRCEIIHASLDQPPAYTAISYAWGDSDDKCDIELEHDAYDAYQGTIRKSTSVRVTVNLRGALRALRREDRDVLIWIDGLSIDQENNEERAHQVRLMPRIYGSAALVAIWLGPDENDSNTALYILKEIAETDRAGRDVSSVIASYAGKPEFGSLVSLFERNYWKRLWVVQEIFIPAPERVHVYCGECSSTWATYKTASDALERCRGTIDRYFPGNKDHDPHHRVSDRHYSFAQVLAMQGPASLPSGGLRNLEAHPLLDIMCLCREKFTANPLDKVYGILGLLPKQVQRDFPVDYKSSVKALYMRIVDHVLSTTKRLDIICEAIHFPLHTSNANLPTWCPDWYHMPATKALRSVSDFRASKDRPARYSFLGDRRLKLKIEAIHLGTVIEHGVAVGTLTTSVDHLTAFLSWRALLLGKAKFRDARDKDELTNIFCRTLCLGQLPPINESLDWRTICYRIFGYLLNQKLPQLMLDDELAQYARLQHVVSSEDCRQRLSMFSRHMMGRRFCLLDDRRLIGLGSGFIGVGDVVVVPLGCSTPVVLRREGAAGEYRYVGDIYIDQYMHGKAVEELDEGRAEAYNYVIH